MESQAITGVAKNPNKSLGNCIAKKIIIDFSISYVIVKAPLSCKIVEPPCKRVELPLDLGRILELVSVDVLIDTALRFSGQGKFDLPGIEFPI